MITVQQTQRIVAFLLATIPACAVLGCASARPASTAPPSCFDARNVRSFSALNERFVFVRVRSDENYLLTLDFVYTTLPFATGIAISGSFSRVCSDTGTMLTFVDAGGPVFCRIIRVEAVPDKDAARKLAEERSVTKPRK